MIGGFSFQGVNAADVGILVAGRTRVIKPENRMVEYVVPAKDGVVSYDSGVYNVFELAVPVVLKEYTYTVTVDDGNNQSHEETRVKTVREIARDVGRFLRGTGSLIFDDEPDKEYIATAVNSIPVSEIVPFGKAEIVFRCQPFAQATAYTQHIHIGATIPTDEVVDVGGTHNTACIINITARGDLSNLTITYTR